MRRDINFYQSSKFVCVFVLIWRAGFTDWLKRLSIERPRRGNISRAFRTTHLYQIVLAYQDQLTFVLLIPYLPEVYLKCKVEVLFALFLQNKNETVRVFIQIKQSVLFTLLIMSISGLRFRILNRIELGLTTHDFVLLHLDLRINLENVETHSGLVIGIQHLYAIKGCSHAQLSLS